MPPAKEDPQVTLIGSPLARILRPSVGQTGSLILQSRERVMSGPMVCGRMAVGNPSAVCPRYMNDTQTILVEALSNKEEIQGEDMAAPGHGGGEGLL